MRKDQERTHGLAPGLLGRLGVRVERLVNDSRRVRPGDVFVAYPGERLDGRNFIAQAITAGAAAVVWEADGFEWRPHWCVPNLPVRGLRALAGELASEVCGQPSHALWMIGVTGTNGKTSCSHWVAQSLGALGRRCALIGTLGSGFPGALDEQANTTPDALVLHPLLAQYRSAGAHAVAMEVSSHGLLQGRVAGVAFDVALFTNLTRDHLDYHGDMESYFAAKARLFDWPGLRHAVINVDDAWGRRLVERLAGRGINVLTYGLGEATIAAHRLDLDRMGLRLEIKTPWGGGAVETALMGSYNALNLLGVLGVLIASDVPVASALPVLAALDPVRGRMQTLGGQDAPLVVVDYAHTPDALEQVLRALRAHLDTGRLVCVFGCGGERDAGKRAQMGAIATAFADRVVLTSDNPRSEPPEAIIAQIASGASGNYDVEPDRAKAIAAAVGGARVGDVVLVAGKGHEAWQEIAGVRRPFDDAIVAARALAARGSGS